jgi:hypothetical protein
MRREGVWLADCGAAAISNKVAGIPRHYYPIPKKMLLAQHDQVIGDRI